MLKKLTVQVKKTIKLIILIIISVFLIFGAVAFFYKPTYSVSINGQHIGYTSNKSQLQEKINQYVDKGEEDNTAFVQVPNLPEYKLCLLKKDVITNDDEIFEAIKKEGIPYYRYYAIADAGEEKAYVTNFEEAEQIVNQLKEKNSTNINEISIVEKYETDKKEFAETETAVASLYKETSKTQAELPTKITTGGQVNTSVGKLGGGKVDIGITLIRPISGTITSRFGVSSRIRSSNHTGLDISAPTGTQIKAAAAGTVSFAGNKGSFGNMIAINHGNGVQTHYCHCSKLYASVGQSVSQGEVIAAVGSTGNSTGPHLHLEVRINGVPYNPQNYVY